MNVAEFHRKNSHMQHRLRVRRAKAIVDDSPPILDVVNFARFSKMKDDVRTYISRYQENARLLVALNKVDRTRGEVDTFRTAENSIATPYSKLLDKHRLLEKIDSENMKIGTKILYAKPELDCWLNDVFIKKREKRKPHSFQYPTLVMNKYSHIEIPSDPIQLKTFLRPKIFFNLDIKGLRPLGRIVIELYTEAAPQVVMEFVRLCFAKEKSRIHIIRLFPHLWLEGNILLDDKTLMKNNIEYDKRSMDHGQYLGVLSFNLKNVFCAAKSILNFSISFKTLNVCNGHRVGFGRVCQGLRVLRGIVEFGNKNGKLYKEIVVSSCGIVS